MLALRARGFKSWGGAPDFLYFGGNSEMRGYDYLQFVGQNAFFANAELRFPLIEAMAHADRRPRRHPRRAFFANIGGGMVRRTVGSRVRRTAPRSRRRSSATNADPLADPNDFVPIYGTPQLVSGFRLVGRPRLATASASQTFALGFPIHFDWSWKTLMNRDWEDVVYSQSGGSYEFRKPQFAMWIGYDF